MGLSAGRLDLQSLLFWSVSRHRHRSSPGAHADHVRLKIAVLVLKLTARSLLKTAADKTVGLHNAKLLSAWLCTCQRTLRYLQGNLWLQIWFIAAPHQPTVDVGSICLCVWPRHLTDHRNQCNTSGVGDSSERWRPE